MPENELPEGQRTVDCLAGELFWKEVTLGNRVLERDGDVVKSSFGIVVDKNEEGSETSATLGVLTKLNTGTALGPNDRKSVGGSAGILIGSNNPSADGMNDGKKLGPSNWTLLGLLLDFTLRRTDRNECATSEGFLEETNDGFTDCDSVGILLG